MSVSSNDGLGRLQQLLALKRHEAPPPAFFHELPDRVIARLTEPMPTPMLSWWRRLGWNFDLSSTFACSVGVLVFGSLLTGMVASERLPRVPKITVLTPAGHHELGWQEYVVTPRAPTSHSAWGLQVIQVTRPELIPPSTTPVRVTSCGFPVFNSPCAR
jgi:hypothetical protein